MKVTATQRIETIIYVDGAIVQTSKKLVRIESNHSGELELDEINDRVIDALRKNKVLTTATR